MQKMGCEPLRRVKVHGKYVLDVVEPTSRLSKGHREWRLRVATPAHRNQTFVMGLER
jgi:hypothetical protein